MSVSCPCGRLTVHQAPPGRGFICQVCRKTVVHTPAPEGWHLFAVAA